MVKPSDFEPIGPLFFDNVFHNVFGNNHTFDNFNIDVIDNGDHYLMQAELPGYKKDEISIHLERNILTVSAEHKKEETQENENYVRQERNYHACFRSFHIPEVNKEDISATYDNGILEIKLPKKSILPEENQGVEIK